MSASVEMVVIAIIIPMIFSSARANGNFDKPLCKMVVVIIIISSISLYDRIANKNRIYAPLS
jgi:hypothetical protein